MNLKLTAMKAQFTTTPSYKVTRKQENGTNAYYFYDHLYPNGILIRRNKKEFTYAYVSYIHNGYYDWVVDGLGNDINALANTYDRFRLTPTREIVKIEEE